HRRGLPPVLRRRGLEGSALRKNAVRPGAAGAGCVEAAQASGDRFYADVAEDTLQYVMRQMTDPEGGFYSAEDADSVPPEQAGTPGAHKMEGACYLWRAGEIDQLFGADAEIVKRRYG